MLIASTTMCLRTSLITRKPPFLLCFWTRFIRELKCLASETSTPDAFFFSSKFGHASAGKASP